MVINKKIAVMMPFGGVDRTHSRHSVLDFMRIKYLIEQRIAVTDRSGQNEVRYSVNAHNLNVGDIAENVITAIAEADILIGVLSEKNINVVYELAVRNLLKDEMLLLVKGDPDELVPIYLKQWANIRLDQYDAQDVLDQIDALAKAPAPRLDLRSPVPSDLIQIIDQQDGSLRSQLENALGQLEIAAPKRPDYILNLAKYLDPGRMLSAWTTYYPYSVVRIKWDKKSNRMSYAPADLNGSAVVYSANEEFLMLYNVATRLPDPDGPQALTGADLLAGVDHAGIVDNLEEFNRDNARVTDTIVFGDGFAWSRVPLRLNQNHPVAQYRKTAYLPTMTGKRIIGDPERPHTAYYLIIYIPVEQ